MAKLMMTVRLAPADANLAFIRRKLKLTKDEIDSQFGVVSLRPEDNLYAVLVEESASARVSNAASTCGPYANPRIEAFGSPKR